MRQSGLRVSGFVLSLLFSVTNGLHLPPNAIDGSLLESYDYIVVGGGASGLVVASRLTEDPSVTVLVLEAGMLDNRAVNIVVPAYIGSDLGTSYDWMLDTTEQEGLNGQKVRLNQGKVVGGGTVLNGMVWTRSSVKDYDLWEDLNNDSSTQYSWRWPDMLPYFEKSETFTADVEASVADELSIHPDMDIHGEAGSVQVGYSNFLYEQDANFLNGMKQMGLPVLSEPNDGDQMGAFVAPSSIDALNQSRSDARVAYFDSVLDRTNLHVASEQRVTQILLASPAFSNTSTQQLQTAVGVEFANSATSARTNITCTKEVILAAGAIFSPTLLQISGIGPQDVLESLGIPVKIDLPGVGANLMDHGMIHPIYQYMNSSLLTSAKVTATDEAREAALDEYFTNRTGPMTAPMISTVAFPSMRYFADDWVELVQNATLSSGDATLPADTDPTVRQGYAAQRDLQLALLRDPTEGAVEFLGDSIGTMSIAMMQTLSRGTVRPQSANIFDLPAVDPRYCAEPLDCIMLARALLFNCALIQTPAMAELQPVVQEPYFCPANVSSSDQDVNERMLQLVKQHVVTEFHPSGSTSMLPLNLGGVVDTALKVYGTSNLRVVDAGIMPVIPGAHLQAVVYGVAERAADIIKEQAQG
ncbi:hypothetical protein N0V93_004237 [Gnomoniopsis smithogilvyi]|uniref:Glucose-methanol-choline oxidoreductase N-terminal domain-containing protein n=1 Tax=Gnomoniopsis smithogilvyi TaxID=1191159 RepID=A0A9W8YR42_9PEZI|nr:hypothetical protein N0V93_004237 [Gnomoniopsis smithogilvyi]